MGAVRLAVFADTNVLASAALRDILIELALDDLIDLYWSPQVLAELRRVLLARPKSDALRIDAMIAAMVRTLPGASVLPINREMSDQFPDVKDIPILLSALASEASILLTFNLKDFPAALVARESDTLKPTHPDAFLIQILTTYPTALIAIVQRIRDALNNPPLSLEDYLENLDRLGLPTSSILLRSLLKL